MTVQPTSLPPQPKPAPQAATQSHLPMFYRELVALDPAHHLGLGLRPNPPLHAAQAANAVPLGISEFVVAASHYPIVFSPQDATAFPIAVTAIVEGRNLFIDANGQWLAGSYVPAWLRRYPFWLQPDADGQNAQLSFDPSANLLVPLQNAADARPLFDYQGQPNQALQEVVQLCKLSMADAQQTAAFMQALQQYGLLVQRQVSVPLVAGAAPYVLSGFRAIDMDRYRQLPEPVLAEWARNGWAALVLVHELSMQHNWQRLLALHHQQADSAAG